MREEVLADVHLDPRGSCSTSFTVSGKRLPLLAVDKGLEPSPRLKRHLH